MPTSFTTQRSILRNIIVGSKLQSALATPLADADLTYRLRPETNGFLQTKDEMESDYQYAGKGTSAATESRIITRQASGDFTTRVDDYLAGWLLAMVMGVDTFTTPNTPSGVTATPSSTGGTIAAGTSYYKVTAIVGGVESAPSAEASAVTTGGTSSVDLAWTAVTGATSYRIYRGTAAGAENAYFTSATNSFTDTGAAGTAGTPPVGGGPNTHVLTWLDNGAPASVTTIYVEDAPGLKRKFQDVSVSKVVLSGTDKGSITAKASFISTGRYTDGAMGAVPALPASPQYLYGSDCTVSIGPAGAPASLVPRVLSFEATFDHQNDLFRSLGGGIYPVFPRFGNPICSLKLVIAIDTTTDIRDWAINHTDLEIKLAIASGAASLTLDYPSVILPNADLSETDKYVTYTIDLNQENILQPTGGQVCTATVVNNAAQYLQLAA